MNRQARLDTIGDLDQPNEWVNFGDISLLEAARRMAILAAKEANYPCYEWHIEVRCESYPEIPSDIYTVRTSIMAEVIDPRKGTVD